MTQTSSTRQSGDIHKNTGVMVIVVIVEAVNFECLPVSTAQPSLRQTRWAEADQVELCARNRGFRSPKFTLFTREVYARESQRLTTVN